MPFFSSFRYLEKIQEDKRRQLARLQEKRNQLDHRNNSEQTNSVYQIIPSITTSLTPSLTPSLTTSLTPSLTPSLTLSKSNSVSSSSYVSNTAKVMKDNVQENSISTSKYHINVIHKL